MYKGRGAIRIFNCDAKNFPSLHSSIILTLPLQLHFDMEIKLNFVFLVKQDSFIILCFLEEHHIIYCLGLFY